MFFKNDRNHFFAKKLFLVISILFLVPVSIDIANISSLPHLIYTGIKVAILLVMIITYIQKKPIYYNIGKIILGPLALLSW